MNWQSREDERVARALDGAPPPHDRDASGLVSLAEQVGEAAGSADLDAAPAFRAALRERLLAEGAALLPHPRRPADPATPPTDPPTLPTGHPDPEPVGAAGPRPVRTGPRRHRPPARAARRRGRQRAAVAGVLAVATLSLSAVGASSTAVPGDTLYGLKKRVQNVEVALAGSDTDRGQRHLELARAHVRKLGNAGPSAPARSLIATLDDMDGETRTGVRMLATVAVRRTDGTRLAELDTWTGKQRSLLATAMPKLPEPARTRAVASAVLLTDVARRLLSLRTALPCACPGPSADDLGPVSCPGCGRPEPVPPTRAAESGPLPVPVPVPVTPTVLASTGAPDTGSTPQRPTPTAGVPVPVPTGAAPTEPPGPSVRPPVERTPPAPRPPEEPELTIEPAPSPSGADGGTGVANLRDGVPAVTGRGD